MSEKMIEFRAVLSELGSDQPGTVRARLVPFGERIEYQGHPIEFGAGQIEIPDAPIPVSLDHGSGSLERIGRVLSAADGKDGLYADLRISDTQAGRDTLTLLRDGVLTDVSAGIALSTPLDAERLEGVLDHVSVVPKGAFGKAGAGSKVLAVMASDEGADTMPEDTISPAPDIAALTASMDELRAVVAELSLPGAITEPEPRPFADVREFLLTLAAANTDPEAARKMAEFALADDTTTTSAGVVPDYLSSRVLEIVDTRRMYLNTIQKDPIGNYGMSIVYPRVVTGPEVDVQSTEKTEVASAAMDIDPDTVPLVTYAGASDVSRQLLERSQPSFLNILMRHYADAYARKTDGDAVSAGVAGAGGTAILADLGNDAAATLAAFNTAAGAIIAGVRVPPTHVALGATRWTQLNSLVDADGRPLLVFPSNNPQNAQGQSSLAQMSGQYHGLTAYLDPNAGATDCLIYNADEFAFWVEQSPIELRAEVVSLLGWEMGVYGLFAHKIEHAAAGYTLTAA